METYKLSLCYECIYTDANGWHESVTGQPWPDSNPMGKLQGWLIGPDETDHICEGHFSWGGCDGCDTALGGDRYCYEGVMK